MNNKGFSLVEFIGCLTLLGIVLCIGLYATRGTLSTSLSTLTNVSENQIHDVAKSYILENKITWINDEDEYTCLTIMELVDDGYFDYDDVVNYKDKYIKVLRNADTKVIENSQIVNICE